MFRQKIKIKRISGGFVDNDGYFVKGEGQVLEILASVQPLNKDDKAQTTAAEAEGGYLTSQVKVYTDFLLRAEKQAFCGREAVESDLMLWQGKVYKIVKVDEYRSNVISHYRAYGQEVEVNANSFEEFSA